MTSDVTFEIKHINTFEVKKHLDSLNVKKSVGLDGIGPRILKYCGDYITPAISSIINSCIDKNIFPELFKHACVIPIHKGGDKNDPHNYRPISILPTLSKIFERHISNQLQDYFQRNNLIHEFQSGFRKNHSCHTALTYLIDSWLKDIDSGKYIGAVFLDLRKAFDLVDHNILLHKLKLYHFSENAVAFLSSYLSNRKQLVKVKNVMSNKLPVTSGVPQGSILGPLLFLLYINDISLSSHTGKTDLYADDTTLHEAGNDIKNIESNLQVRLSSINDWCRINNMALHPNKTKCMIIGSKYKMRKGHQMKLSIDNLHIENVTSQTILGVIVDNTLSWDLHVNSVRAKVNSKINLLKRISFYVSHDMKVLYYNAYIMSTFDYCCTVWGGTSKVQNIIFKTQKRVARLILNKPVQTSSKSMFSELQWLTFEQRYYYYIALLVFKSKHNLTPSYICNLVSFANNEHYNLRSASKNNLNVMKFKTNNLKTSFTHSSAKIWNSLPSNIKNITKLQTFKYQCKKHLLNISKL